MRTTKVISISLPPAQYKEAARLAKKENRTMSELMREALRTYKDERERRAPLRAAVQALREDARRNGTDKMTMDEINAEIAAYRREKYGAAKSA